MPERLNTLDNSRRALLLGGSALTLALATGGCATIAADASALASKITATISTDVNMVVNNWAAIKGIGEAALAAASTILAPAESAAITAGIATVDAIVASLPSLAAGSAALASAISNIIAEGQAVFAAAVPAVKVTPSLTA